MSPVRVKSFFTFKDKMLLQGLIYEFKSGGCNATYFGKTKILILHTTILNAKKLCQSEASAKLKAKTQAFAGINKNDYPVNFQGNTVTTENEQEKERRLLWIKQ